MKKLFTTNTIRVILATIFAVSIQATAISKTPDSMNRSRIKPTKVDLKTGDTQQFYVIKEPARLTAAFATNKVVWFVNGIKGGNATVGTISAEGLYTAPEKKPDSPEIHIGARINSSSNKNLWATVLLDSKTPKYKTVNKWEEIDNLNAPTSFAVEKNGNILFVDGKIKRFSTECEFIHQMGESIGEFEGSVLEPLEIAVDPVGNIVLSNKRTGPPRIQIFEKDGTFLRAFAPKGTTTERVMDTRGIAFNSKNQIYIGDIDNMRVSVFEHSGELVQTIGGKGSYPGKLNVPYGLDIDPNDDLFVASYFGPCQKFTTDGHLLDDFLYPDPPSGPVYFTDLACNQWGDVYILIKGAKNEKGEFADILDKKGNPVHILKYNNNGDFICNISLSEKNIDALQLEINELGELYVFFQTGEGYGVEIIKQK